MRLNKTVKTMLIAGCLSALLSATAFAATSQELGDAISKSGVTVTADMAYGVGGKTDGNQGTDQDVTVTASDGNTYYMTSAQADKLKGQIESQAKANQEAADAEKKTTTDVKNQISGDASVINKTFGKADLNAAGTALSGFSSWIQLMTGILATLAIIGTTLFTAVDVCYLAFPVMQGKMNEAGNSGGAMSGTTKNGEAKFKFVTDDAVEAYQEAHGGGANGQGGGGGNQWVIYLKKRAFAFIFLAIIIFILLTGKISFIIEIALKAVDGIINQLGNMA